jgi:hypothetical protein
MCAGLINLPLVHPFTHIHFSVLGALVDLTRMESVATTASVEEKTMRRSKRMVVKKNVNGQPNKESMVSSKKKFMEPSLEMTTAAASSPSLPNERNNALAENDKRSIGLGNSELVPKKRKKMESKEQVSDEDDGGEEDKEEEEEDKVSSSHIGVCWIPSRRKWRSRVRRPDHKREHIGYFDDETEAASRYDERFKQLYQGRPHPSKGPSRKKLRPNAVGKKIVNVSSKITLFKKLEPGLIVTTMGGGPSLVEKSKEILGDLSSVSSPAENTASPKPATFMQWPNARAQELEKPQSSVFAQPERVPIAAGDPLHQLLGQSGSSMLQSFYDPTFLKLSQLRFLSLQQALLRNLQQQDYFPNLAASTIRPNMSFPLPLLGPLNPFYPQQQQQQQARAQMQESIYGRQFMP